MKYVEINSTGHGDQVFTYCTTLETVKIGANCDNLSLSMFAGCTSLSSVTIAAGLEEIGKQAFYNCSSLSSIVIPASTTEISAFAFCGCSSLTSITFADNSKIKTIGYNALCKATFTTVTIPASIETLGFGVFDSCVKLTALYMEAATPPTRAASDRSDYDTVGNGNYQNSDLFYGTNIAITVHVPTEAAIAEYSAEETLWKPTLNNTNSTHTGDVTIAVTPNPGE